MENLNFSLFLRIVNGKEHYHFKVGPLTTEEFIHAICTFRDIFGSNLTSVCREMFSRNMPELTRKTFGRVSRSNVNHGQFLTVEEEDFPLDSKPLPTLSILGGEGPLLSSLYKVEDRGPMNLPVLLHKIVAAFVTFEKGSNTSSRTWDKRI